MKTNKALIILTIIGWLNIGLFYSLHLMKIENVLIGLFRELTIIPSYLLGILSPTILLLRLAYKLLFKIIDKKI
tara:strand:+ start:738 stop:959 length:222 start_codon:yes stop_codon:yes gene_type:complete